MASVECCSGRSGLCPPAGGSIAALRDQFGRERTIEALKPHRRGIGSRKTGNGLCPVVADLGSRTRKGPRRAAGFWVRTSSQQAAVPSCCAESPRLSAAGSASLTVETCGSSTLSQVPYGSWATTTNREKPQPRKAEAALYKRRSLPASRKAGRRRQARPGPALKRLSFEGLS
jgi:hypothetical protein